MLTLVTGDVLIYIAQLVFDHAQTVTDELRSTDGDLVLVLNPFLVVHFNQGVQNVFSLLNGGIVDTQIDNGGILVSQFRMQSGCIIIGDGTHITFSITYGSAHE